MRLSSEGGLFRRRLLSSSPWPAPIAMGAAGRRPLPGAGRSPARLAPPAVGAAPRFAQGGQAVRPAGALALRCGALPPLVAPSLARPGLRSLRGVLARFALGGGRAAGGGRRFPLARLAALGSPPPLPSGGLCRPPLRAGFLWRFAPPEEKGFLSPLRRRHGDYLIAHYAAQHAENLCVAHTVTKAA